MRKHGGEKGVPFRVQIDTFKENEAGEYTEHLHSASCQVKVFKPKGADRKQKTDREKMEKRAPQEKEKYQPSYETTILTECSPWPEITYVNNSPSPGFNSTHSSFPVIEGNGSPNHQPEPVIELADLSCHLLTRDSESNQVHEFICSFEYVEMLVCKGFIKSVYELGSTRAGQFKGECLTSVQGLYNRKTD